MLWEHRGFTLSGDKAGHDLLWVPSAHRDVSLSRDGDVQLKIEDVAARQFFSRKVPGSPFGFPKPIPALQKIGVFITGDEVLGSFGEGNSPVNPEECY